MGQVTIIVINKARMIFFEVLKLRSESTLSALGEF